MRIERKSSMYSSSTGARRRRLFRRRSRLDKRRETRTERKGSFSHKISSLVSRLCFPASHRHRHRFHFGVIPQRIFAKFPADAAHFETTKRSGGIEDVVAVHPD